VHALELMLHSRVPLGAWGLRQASAKVVGS
jgi:hypothetical protein